MSSNLESWLEKINAAKSRVDIFRILEDFRPLEWTDEQRAAMAKTYMRVLDGLAPGKEASAPAATATTTGDDGPVWYEKM